MPGGEKRQSGGGFTCLMWSRQEDTFLRRSTHRDLKGSALLQMTDGRMGGNTFLHEGLEKHKLHNALF